MNDELTHVPLKETVKTTLKGHQKRVGVISSKFMGLCWLQNHMFGSDCVLLSLTKGC